MKLGTGKLGTGLRKLAHPTQLPGDVIKKVLRKGAGPDWGKLLCEGGEKGFETLYEGLRASVYRYAFLRLRRREAAEELTQEVFVKVYRFKESYRPEYSFEAWFWALVRNAISDWHRKASTVREVDAGWDDDDESALEQFESDAPDAEKILLGRSSRREMFRLLKGLTRLQKKVLWLRFVHDLSLQEIAERLELSLAAVKCLLYRARAAMKAILEPELCPAF